MVMFEIPFIVLTIVAWFTDFTIAAFEIKGAPAYLDPATGSLPQRKEITEFARSGAAFDLFVLAVQKMQALDQVDSLSYFQIAGIHGYPVTPWDGVIGTVPDKGYCMHASVLFPLWHRPYLALFEQRVWAHAQEIAATYPVEQVGRYKAAALGLRIPYWDWAVNPAIPTSYVIPAISINTPTGYHEIKNPLYRYDFHPGAEGNGFPPGHNLSDARFTTRWSDLQLDSSDDPAATSAMLALAPNTLSDTYQLLTSVADYTQFSSVLGDGGLGAANNLETIHNRIHTIVGGWYGSMFWPEFAAFDPIFYLHHAQVDRLVALWQALYPNDYVVPKINPLGSYFEPANTMDTDTTSLAPFHSDNATTMYTAGSVRDMSRFGYTYPELAGLNRASGGGQQQAMLRSRINALYNTKAAPLQRSKVEVKSKESPAFPKTFNRITLKTAMRLGINNLSLQWAIRIQVSYFAYKTPISIHFFMGVPPKDTTTWSTAANLVAVYSQFRLADPDFAGNTAGSGPSTRSEISITHTLAAAVSQGMLSNLSPSQVVPLLQEHLTWKATSGDREVCLEGIDGLKITVLSRKVKPSKKASEFPRYGKYVEHPTITSNKPMASRPGNCRSMP